MLDQGFFKNHFVGRDGFIWWIGQIADENTWKANIPGFPAPTNEPTEGEAIGFGERYKVRIMGYHTAAPSQLVDEDLPWATVMYPVTAGGGGRGSSQNANLTQGCFVFGFFLDGDNAQQPVIMGCMGYNDYQAVMKNVPDAKFLPFSGYTPKDKIATTGIKDNENPEERLEQAQKDGTDFDSALESSTSSTTRSDLASEEQKKDGQKQEALSIRSDCRPIPTAKINTFQKNLLKQTKELKKAKKDKLKTLTIDTTEIDKKIEEVTKKFSKLISAEMKWSVAQVEKSTIEKINTEAKKKYDEVFPNERQKLKEEVEKVNDELSCAFRNIMDGLETVVGGLLADMVKKAVNAPPCMADNMVGAMIGQVANSVQNTVNGILGGLDGLLNFPSPFESLGGLGGGAGGGEVLDVIEDIVSLLDCDEKSNCPEVTELSLWDGGTVTPDTGLSNLSKIAKGFSDTFNDFKMLEFSPPVIAFDQLFGAGGCNSGPVACGPPTVKFFGGKGSGAAGNLIVGILGEIISYDPVEFGINYDDDVNAVVVDLCGKGQGAVVEPVIGEYTDPDGNIQIGVLNINVIQAGTGYLGIPDGSTGGDGEVWSNPEDTSITHADGELEIPTSPGNVVTVVAGDTVLLPPGTEVVTESLTPSDVQQIILDQTVQDAEDDVNLSDIFGVDITIDSDIGTQLPTGVGGNERIKGGKSHVVESPGKFTTPSLPLSRSQGPYPSSGDGAYPAITYLCDVVVVSPGINYNENDQIIIEPNVGATAVPKFNENGSLVSVKVTAGGEGFTQMPDVYIKSETGFQAELRPVFCIDRIAKDEVKEYDPKDKVKLITVIDCVGKIDRNQFVGYVNGEPYYGPFHIHAPTGVKMVGARHVSEPHDVITDRPNTPSKRPYINQEDVT